MPKKPIYSSEQKTEFATWSANAEKDVYLHDTSLDESNIFSYPEDPGNDDNFKDPFELSNPSGEGSWINFEEHSGSILKDENGSVIESNYKSSSLEGDKVLASSLTTILAMKEESTLEQSGSSIEPSIAPMVPSKLSCVVAATTTSSGSIHEDANESKHELKITVSPQLLLLLVGCSFSLGYLIGLQGYKFLKDQRIRYKAFQ
ncbi:hypothetical protein DASC09_040520 [Saccharomycopsis crataegensis]|uniref:Uncharacterized protein n=1 Tax=Saccharomycopsis crataegensis TaxID=43959 RepID=A0AAV5QQG0_9ASCO|nr:hypothetical protein DASC09_040520 [Saccharomycopsis crataegensis]